MQETIKSENSFDEWETERDYKIALKNNYWSVAVNDLLNETLENNGE